MRCGILIRRRIPYTLELSIVDAKDTVLDAHWKERFGFREFWIEGRDFYLNGTRIFLSAVPLDNAQIGAALATYRSDARNVGAAEELRNQLRLHAQLWLRAGVAFRFCRSPARG